MVHAVHELLRLHVLRGLHALHGLHGLHGLRGLHGLHGLRGLHALHGLRGLLGQQVLRGHGWRTKMTDLQVLQNACAIAIAGDPVVALWLGYYAVDMNSGNITMAAESLDKLRNLVEE